MILVDLQKACESLDHIVRLQKMECIGYKKSVMKWFQSWLLDRNFLPGLINCGVPQGSILRPLFSLIYINDLPQALNDTGSYIFYDSEINTYTHTSLPQ